MKVIWTLLFFFIKLSFAMARKSRKLRVPKSKPIVITRGGYRK